MFGHGRGDCDKGQVMVGSELTIETMSEGAVVVLTV